MEVFKVEVMLGILDLQRNELQWSAINKVVIPTFVLAMTGWYTRYQEAESSLLI